MLWRQKQSWRLSVVDKGKMLSTEQCGVDRDIIGGRSNSWGGRECLSGRPGSLGCVSGRPGSLSGRPGARLTWPQGGVLSTGARFCRPAHWFVDRSMPGAWGLPVCRPAWGLGPAWGLLGRPVMPKTLYFAGIGEAWQVGPAKFRPKRPQEAPRQPKSSKTTQELQDDPRAPRRPTTPRTSRSPVQKFVY